jgi:hypothetical protein
VVFRGALRRPGAFGFLPGVVRPPVIWFDHCPAFPDFRLMKQALLLFDLLKDQIFLALAAVVHQRNYTLRLFQR